MLFWEGLNCLETFEYFYHLSKYKPVVKTPTPVPHKIMCVIVCMRVCSVHVCASVIVKEKTLSSSLEENTLLLSFDSAITCSVRFIKCYCSEDLRFPRLFYVYTHFPSYIPGNAHANGHKICR